MPLKRTPPTKATPEPGSSKLVAPELNIQYSSSEQDLRGNHFADTDSSTQVSRRPKRKVTETSVGQITTFMSEMRAMFNDLKEQQNLKMEKICSAIEEIKIQNSDIRASVEFLSSKYDTLLGEIHDVKSECKDNQNYTKALEEKIDILEKNARSTCIEIKNIPVKTSETKDCLLKNLRDIGHILNVPIQSQDVKDIFRTGSKDPKNRTIIAEFTSTLTKEQIIRTYRKYNRGPSKLSTENLKLSGPVKPVFISENLTPKMKRLFYLAREFAKSNEYGYCWSSNGRIFIREKEGAPLHWIKEESDLKKIEKI